MKEEIFTPEKLEKMREEARKQERVESVRSGDCVPDGGSGPEEFVEMGEKPDRAAAHKVNKIKLRPQPRSAKKAGAENYGWLNAWQDKNEIDGGKRRIIN